jgi:hypothetical protein
LSKYCVKPLASKYAVTTYDPGEREFFIYGRTDNRFSTAFLAKSPALNITPGFEVFVHEVIADMTTLP